MRLNEIFNAEKSDQRWTDQLQALIDKHGLKKFNGTQATVITTPDHKYVYRIWAKDPGYEKWLETALKMQNNPHIVKIAGRVRTIQTKFKGLPSDVKLKFVKLEKLDHLKGDERLESFIFIVSEVINNWNISERNEHDIDSFIKTIIAAAEFADEDEVSAEKYVKEHRSFLQTVLELSRKGYNDWSIENIMLRGTTLVIVDPLSEN